MAGPLAPDAIAPRVPIANDRELFEAFDLDRPELAAVKTAVASGDFAAAKRAMLDCFRQRRSPVWFENWWQRPPKTTNAPPAELLVAAEKILAHQFAVAGASVQFPGPIGWRYSPTPSEQNPSPLTLFINRFTWWRDALGPAYWATGDERYAIEWAAQVTDWTARNPAPQVFNERLTPAPWGRLTAAYSIPMWISGLNYFLPSPAVTPDTLAAFLKAVIQKARYSIRNPDRVHRRLVQLEAVHAAATYFPELRDAARWRQWALDELDRFIAEGIYPDGALKELAPGYQTVAIASLRNIVALAAANDAPLRYNAREALARACDHLGAIMLPDGTVPQFGDTWAPAFVAPELRRALEFYPPEKGRQRRDELIYIASRGQAGEPPPAASTVAPWAGIYVMRGPGRTNANARATFLPGGARELGAGWRYTDVALAFRCGPFGKEHQHEDKLSFVLYGFGARLLDEMGIYSTANNLWRDYFTSSAAHNTVLVDGLGQNRRSQPATWATHQPLAGNWLSNDAFDFVSGVYDDGWGPQNLRTVSQRREIFFAKPDYWVLHDLLSGSGTHTYEALFHMQPANDLRVHDQTRVCFTSNLRRPNLAIYPVDNDIEVEVRRGWTVNPTDPLSPRQGWFSLGLQKVEAAPCAILRRRGPAPQVLESILLPALPADAADIAAERLAVTDDMGRSLDRTEVCALRIYTRVGADIYINDLRIPNLDTARSLPKKLHALPLGTIEFGGKMLLLRLGNQRTPVISRWSGAQPPIVAGQPLPVESR
ncbi:MAG: heparinase II/III family protein [Verrucomicrobiae bacterium]|nr:heparinase II/III family protein [Verrucomicrobiae bacterium]